MEVFIPIVIILLLIALNGLFVAAEFSIIGVPYTCIAQVAQEGSRIAKRVLSRLSDFNLQNRYIATAQVGITLASLGLGMYGEHIVSEWLLVPIQRISGLTEPTLNTLAVILAIFILTYLHVVLGEMVPKSIALQDSEPTVIILEGPMSLMERVFYPIVTILNGTGNLVLKLVGIPPASPGSRLMTPDELELVVEESFEGGMIAASEHLFIDNIFDLGERSVGQIMTPRTHIIGISADADEDEVMQIICEGRYTRLPVYKDNFDQIIGILHLKNLARRQVHPDGKFDLYHLVSPAVFIPESISLEDMLIQFRRESIQMAIVMDEFGGTAGLVTTEDLVEEVVGEILDEFDREIPPMQVINHHNVRVRGDLLLDELNQHFALSISHPDANTVAGLLMALLGRVVKQGDRVEIEGVTFQVESIKGFAVQTILIQLPDEN
jgi:CBS domain containing-hemolysin-like protein